MVSTKNRLVRWITVSPRHRGLGLTVLAVRVALGEALVHALAQRSL